MQVTSDTLRALGQVLGVSTILGIDNAGFGMPDQTRSTLPICWSPCPGSLGSALVDPATPGLVERVRSLDFLVGGDPYGSSYIEHYRARRTAISG